MGRRVWPIAYVSSVSAGLPPTPPSSDERLLLTSPNSFHSYNSPPSPCTPPSALLHSILMGILGNLVTGIIVGSTGSYRPVFGITVLLYITSFAAFTLFMRGGAIRLTPPSRSASG